MGFKILFGSVIRKKKSLAKKAFKDCKVIMKDERNIENTETKVKDFFLKLKDPMNASKHIQKFLENLNESLRLLHQDISTQLLTSNRILGKFMSAIKSFENNPEFLKLISVHDKHFFQHLKNDEVHKVMQALKEIKKTSKVTTKSRKRINFFKHGLRYEDKKLYSINMQIDYYFGAMAKQGKHSIIFFKNAVDHIIKYFEELETTIEIEDETIVDNVRMAKDILDILNDSSARKRVEQFIQSKDLKDLASQIQNILSVEHDVEVVDFKNVQRVQKFETELEKELKHAESQISKVA